MSKFCLSAMVALMFVLSSALPTYGRDDPKPKDGYHCEVCDDPSYRPTKCKSLVFFSVVGVNAGASHRMKTFYSSSACGFVFNSSVEAKQRICTAWHVVEPLAKMEGGRILAFLWNMRDTVKVRVAYYSKTLDLAVLDFADQGYVFPWDALDLGDEASMHADDDVTAMGAPRAHCFMESNGPCRGLEKDDGGILRLAHLAKIAPGNSGGPLVDHDGKVVGVNIEIHIDMFERYKCSIAARVSDLKAMLAREQAPKKKLKKCCVCDNAPMPTG